MMELPEIINKLWDIVEALRMLGYSFEADELEDFIFSLEDSSG